MTASHDPYAHLSPPMQDVVRGMMRMRRPPLHTQTVQAVRRAYAAGADVLEIPLQSLPRVQDLRIPARDGVALPARLYAAQAEGHSALPLLLYLHGGGFVLGSVATHDRLCRTLAWQAQCAVVSLDYRLAPEHVFPTAHNDSWDALQWLARSAGWLGCDPARLAVGGDSAGGTLAAACALHARDAGLTLALQLLIYPGTTAWQDTDSHRRFAADPVLPAAHIQWFFGHYVPDGLQRSDWRFAPLLADDVQGVAPAFFCLAEADPLVDEALAFADMLRMAAVPVDLAIYRGVTHEFIKMGRVIPQAVQAHADMARALRLAFGLLDA